MTTLIRLFRVALGWLCPPSPVPENSSPCGTGGGLEPMRSMMLIRWRKGDDRYLFIGDDTRENRDEFLRVLGQFAMREDLNFTWLDAMRLSQRVRNVPCPEDAECEGK